MSDQIITPAAVQHPRLDADEIEVSAEEYMEFYAEHHYEWVQGVTYKMSPIQLIHYELVEFLRMLVNAYFSLNPMGRILGEPFVLKMESIRTFREPDLQVILKSNPGQLTDTAMIGAADICIEVVSPSSVGDDYRDKFAEYQQGGVQEYWIIDPQKKECRFHRLQPNGLYAVMALDSESNYSTPLLPYLKLHVPTLWQAELPDFYAIGEMVKAMLAERE